MNQSNRQCARSIGLIAKAFNAHPKLTLILLLIITLGPAVATCLIAISVFVLPNAESVLYRKGDMSFELNLLKQELKEAEKLTNNVRFAGQQLRAKSQAATEAIAKTEENPSATNINHLVDSVKQLVETSEAASVQAIEADTVINQVRQGLVETVP